MAANFSRQCVAMTTVWILCLVTVGFAGFVFVAMTTGLEADSPVTHWHLIIDEKLVTNCKTAAPSVVDLPCFTAPKQYLSKEGGIGPLKCIDDDLNDEQSASSSPCATRDDTFRLNGNMRGVTVRKPGVYRFYAQVTFKEEFAKEVVVFLMVNSRRFMQCHQQNFTPSGRAGAPLTACTLQGERRLRAGDTVSVFQPYRLLTVFSDPKSTFWGIVRVAD